MQPDELPSQKTMENNVPSVHAIISDTVCPVLLHEQRSRMHA